MKEKMINSIVQTLKSYKDTQNKEDLLVLIKEYSKIGLYEEVSKYTREFFNKEGGIPELIEISDNFPKEIKDFFKGSEKGVDEDFDGDSFLEMGELLWEIGAPDEAKENYQKAFEYYNILGEVNAAEEVLNTLKEHYPDDPVISTIKIKNIKEDLLSKFGSLDKPRKQDEIELRYTLAKRLHAADLLFEAESNYRRILDLDEKHKAGRLLVALLRDKGSYDECLKYAKKLEKNERLEEYYSIAEDLRDFGNLDKSKSVLREIYNIDPEFKDVKELLGVALEEKGKIPFVEEVLEEVKKAQKAEVGKAKGVEEKKKIVFL